MKFFTDVIIFTLLFLAVIVGIPNNSFGQPADSVKSPQQFKLSFSERFRLETWDNAVTLSKDAKAGTSYTRFRTSIMGQWMPAETFEIGVKISHEFRNYLSPTTNAFHMNEVFFDQLYMKWNTKKFINGVLTIGRQDIILGEGFVVIDGNPLDGSRSLYFNALRYDWNLNSNNNISLFGLYLPRTDKLPVINGNDVESANLRDHTWNLVDQTETGAGIYFTGNLTNGDIQSYYIRKDYIEPDKNSGQISSGVNTLGSRLNISLNENFNSTIECAYQAGKAGDNKKRAYGGYLYVDFTPAWQMKLLPRIMTLGTIYLSGDDPATKTNEGWDPLFSRWPKWSDSYCSTLIREFNGKVAYWSNFFSVYASLKFRLDSQLGFNFDYHHLMAPRAAAGSIFPGGAGRVRGEFFKVRLLLDINKNLSGHLQFEHFKPGSYYFSGADASNWTRVELTYKL